MRFPQFKNVNMQMTNQFQSDDDDKTETEIN